MVLKDYRQFGGRHSEFAALHNALAYQGVISPYTGEALSEAMLFGIGAGVGASYFNFAYEGYAPTLSINVIGRYKAKYGEVMWRTAERLGLETTFNTTGSRAVATRYLSQGLGLGRPVLVQVTGSLSYYPLQDFESIAEHALVIWGVDQAKGVVYVADTARLPLSLTLEELEGARSAYGPLKQLSMTVAPGTVHLSQAVQTAIKSCAGLMVEPPAPKGNFGLPALKKWADLVVEPGERGWLAMFAPGEDLYRALATAFAHIELTAVGGGAMRNMYAEFLADASQVLAQSVLEEVAEQFETVARSWTALAECLLPDAVPDLARTKSLMRRKQALFQEKAGQARVELEALNQEQAALARVMSEGFPLNTPASRDLLVAIRQQILQVLAAETKAFEALQMVAADW